MMKDWTFYRQTAHPISGRRWAHWNLSVSLALWRFVVGLAMTFNDGSPDSGTGPGWYLTICLGPVQVQVWRFTSWRVVRPGYSHG